MYTVTFSKKAIKALRKFPKKYQMRIKNGVDKLSIDPFKMDLEKMQTSDATHRLRIGAYRLFLQIDTTTKEVIVSTIKRRTTQTYR
ncbi:type II toxin-antitoxin system RelE/ParE family toxin [Candidatus Microgenomates bacterium]|nr:type II toxin-antitoxin system RelE/ParE family toxin [Candidatus Microgenomates bacterium]